MKLQCGVCGDEKGKNPTCGVCWEIEKSSVNVDLSGMKEICVECGAPLVMDGFCASKECREAVADMCQYEADHQSDDDDIDFGYYDIDNDWDTPEQLREEDDHERAREHNRDQERQNVS